MSFKICHLSSAHKSHDTRIFYKECVTLAEAGYEVYYVVCNAEKDKDRGVNIVNVPFNNKGRLTRMTSNMWKVAKEAYKTKSDIYHFHDPELIPAGIALSLLGKKVVYDVHEDLPSDILDKNWIGNKFLRKIVSLGAKGVEYTGAFFFKGVAAVTPDIAKRFPLHKTILLRNLPVVKLIDSVPAADIKKEKIAIIYSGGLTRIRGIREIIEALEFVGDKVELWLLGPWESQNYHQECESLLGYKKVKYWGNVDQEKVFAITKCADIGIVNFLPIANHFTAMPNKPFEYMSCALPMIMSDFPFWHEYFEEAALFSNPEDPHDIADKINQLVNSVELRKKTGDIGRKLVDEKYSWEAESKNLLNLYEQILKK